MAKSARLKRNLNRNKNKVSIKSVNNNADPVKIKKDLKKLKNQISNGVEQGIEKSENLLSSTPSGNGQNNKKHRQWMKSVMAALQNTDDETMKKKITSWFEYAAQAMTTPHTNPHDIKLFYCVITLILCKAADIYKKDQKAIPKIEPLRALVKNLVPELVPGSKNNRLTLSFFNELTSKQPAAVIGIKDQLESTLLSYLSYDISDISSTKGFSPNEATVVQLAASAFCKLPIVTPGQESNSQSKLLGSAAVKGKHFNSLVACLSQLVDEMLSNVVQSQKFPLPDFALEITSSPSFAVFNQAKPNASDNPVNKMKDGVSRCRNILTFLDIMLVNVVRGEIPRINVTPTFLLSTLFKILQVSSNEISKYKVQELQFLSKVWCKVQQKALESLNCAMLTLGSELLCCSSTLTHLTETLLAISPLTENDLKQENEKISDTQLTVIAAYECIATLIKLSKGREGISLNLAKRLVTELTLQHKVIKLKYSDTYNISSMKVRKKTKSKGYTVTSDAFDEEINTVNNLSISYSNSETLVDKVLEILVSIYSLVPQTVLELDVLQYLHATLMSLIENICETFGRADSSNNYLSVSGYVNLLCLLEKQSLFAKFLQVVVSAVSNPHPTYPYSFGEVLRHLEHAKKLHFKSHQITSVCSAGISVIRMSLMNPRIALYQRCVDDTSDKYDTLRGDIILRVEEEEKEAEETAEVVDLDGSDADSDVEEVDVPQDESLTEEGNLIVDESLVEEENPVDESLIEEESQVENESLIEEITLEDEESSEDGEEIVAVEKEVSTVEDESKDEENKKEITLESSSDESSSDSKKENKKSKRKRNDVVKDTQKSKKTKRDEEPEDLSVADMLAELG